MKTLISRTAARDLINDIMTELAMAKAGELSERQALDTIEHRLKALGIELPVKCTGEAHSNPHIDNCGVCAPKWGWVGTDVKVK